MNDLDDLKQAMDSPPGFAPRELDLSEIIRVGGRFRRRRKLIAGSAAAAAVVVLLVGGSQLIGTHDNPGRGTPLAPAAAPSPTLTLTPSAQPTLPFEAPHEPLGSVIRTGVPAKRGEWVLYGVTIETPRQPGTNFGFMLGVRQHNGHVESAVETNETEGAALNAGFHAVEGSMVLDQGASLTFGYFVGPAYRITAIAHGKTVTAGQRKWSKNPSVVVFWFDPAKIGPGAGLSHLTAYDRLGRKLSSGNPTMGVG